MSALGTNSLKTEAFFFFCSERRTQTLDQNSTSWEVKSFSGQFVVRVCVCVRLMWNVKQVNWLLITLTHTQSEAADCERCESVCELVSYLSSDTLDFSATGFLQAFTSSGAVNQSDSQIGCGWGWGQGWGALTSIKAREWIKVAFKYSNPASKWNVSNVFQRLLLSERKTLCSKHWIILFYTQDSLLSVSGMNLWVKKKKKKKTKGSFMLYVLHIRIQMEYYVHIRCPYFCTFCDSLRTNRAVPLVVVVQVR